MSSALVATLDPIGRPLQVPATVADDTGARFDPTDTDGLREYYEANGYVVITGVVPEGLCRRANDAFDREAKPDPRPFYRLSGMPERHEWTSAGFMEHGIRDVQSLSQRRHGGFRQAGLDVVSQPAVQAVTAAVLGEPPKLVQTMYFEGNPATQPHQDTYYLDGERLGSMVAAWVACEDIAAGAGRFWICPGSHRLDLPRNEGDHNIAEHHDRYLDAVTTAMRTGPLEVRAPALARGDVLLWSARTIHGSLPTDTPERSRRSFTAHYIPAGSAFLQWQRRVVPLELATVGGIAVHHPKDQNRLRHQVRYHAETRLPGPAAAAKRVVSARLLRR